MAFTSNISDDIKTLNQDPFTDELRNIALEISDIIDQSRQPHNNNSFRDSLSHTNASEPQQQSVFMNDSNYYEPFPSFLNPENISHVYAGDGSFQKNISSYAVTCYSYDSFNSVSPFYQIDSFSGITPVS